MIPTVVVSLHTAVTLKLAAHEVDDDDDGDKGQ